MADLVKKDTGDTGQKAPRFLYGHTVDVYCEGDKREKEHTPRTQYAQVLKTRFVFSVYEAFSPFKCIPH